MRVTFACLLVAVGLGLATAPVAAQPAGRLDVEPVIAALDSGERIVRAPDAVARFDEVRVREELGRKVRVVVLPYVDYGLYEDANGESRYNDLVRKPILEWALDRDVSVVLVYTFDHYTMRDSPNGVPRRGVVVPPPHAPGVLQAGQVALALGGVLTGTVALFALLRTARAAESRTRSEKINVRLNRLADTVLHPKPTTDATVARRQADLAERYVLLLAAVEAATTADEHADADRDLSDLEKAAGVTSAGTLRS